MLLVTPVLHSCDKITCCPSFSNRISMLSLLTRFYTVSSIYTPMAWCFILVKRTMSMFTQSNIYSHERLYLTQLQWGSRPTKIFIITLMIMYQRKKYSTNKLITAGNFQVFPAQEAIIEILELVHRKKTDYHKRGKGHIPNNDTVLHTWLTLLSS